MELLTPASVAGLLGAHGLRPRKALGQHFLADPNTARRIVRVAGIAAGDPVLEIGPGLGSLTLALVDAGARVTALEIDPALARVVREVTADLGVVVIDGDALRADLSALVPAPGPWSVVSNLPYNVAAPVVVRLLEAAPMVDRLLVMVQREVGDRLAAVPGDPDNGAISVKVAYYGAARVVGTVPPTVFVPAPRVDSALVQIVRHSRAPVDVPDVESLFSLVRAGFGQRRKILRRSLRVVIGPRTDVVLAAAAVDPGARAEVLTLAQWAALARAVAADAA